MRTDLVVVDDDPDHLELCLLALAGCCEGEFVRTFTGGVDLLAFLGACSATDLPRLVLMDLKLGAESGLEVLRQMRADRTTAHVPVIIHSSSNESEDVVRAYAAGASAFLRKPVSLDALRLSLRTAYRCWVGMVRTPQRA